MYELKNGTARIIDALEKAVADKNNLQILSKTLNYYPEQLEQDIKAVADYYKIFQDKETESSV